MSILTNFLRSLQDEVRHHEFVVAVANRVQLERIDRRGIEILEVRSARLQAAIPFVNASVLPRLAEKTACTAALNFGDIPMATPLPQVYLLDWPYAIYPDASAWDRGSFAETAARRLKLRLLQRTFKYVDVVIAQHASAADRARRHLGARAIEVIPNAVSLDDQFGAEEHDYALGPGIKLLCLSRYYSHKNLEVFLSVAEMIRAEKLRWIIVVTIDSSHGSGARRFLKEVNQRHLSSIIHNVGAVTMSRVPSLYRQCDVLVLPTLLESFSGTYVEAMHYAKPIVTTDADFAREVCGSAAIYIDPLDGRGIFATLKALLNSPTAMRSIVAAGKERLSRFPTWQRVAASYVNAVERAAAAQCADWVR